MADSRPPFPRQLYPRIQHDLGVYPVVAVMGARQVGKTTLTRQLAGERGMAYRSLDDRGVREQAAEDPEGLIEEVARTGAVFDEIQRAPDLLLALKAAVDREGTAGRFLLTGSNQPRLSTNMAESLAGRVAYRTLRPLTLTEQRYDDRPGAWSNMFTAKWDELGSHLEETARLNAPLDWQTVTSAGGMPRALAAPPGDRLQVLEDYLRTFTTRDVREVLGVESVERLEQFVRLVAVRTGHELNLSRMASDLGQPVSTLRRWYGALERSYLVTSVSAFSRNPSARAIKSPKLFMVDSAMAMAGAGDHVPTGWQFETLVANDLLVWRDESPGRTLAHWRTPSGPEVDFILGQGKQFMGIELKVADAVDRHDARHLVTFINADPDARTGLLLSSDSRIRMLGERVMAAPWWSVL